MSTPNLFDALQILAIDLAARAADPAANGAGLGLLGIAEALNEATRLADDPRVRRYLQAATLEKPGALSLQLGILRDRREESDYQIARLLKAGSATIQQMADATGLSNGTIHPALARLQRAGIVEACGHAQRDRDGKPGPKPTLYRLVPVTVAAGELDEAEDDADVDELEV